jgi:hypothetical protein
MSQQSATASTLEKAAPGLGPCLSCTKVRAHSVPVIAPSTVPAAALGFGLCAAEPRDIDALFANVRWEKVNRGRDEALRLNAIFRGAGS